MCARYARGARASGRARGAREGTTVDVDGKGEARAREGAAARRTVHFSARVVVLMGEGSFCKKLP